MKDCLIILSTAFIVLALMAVVIGIHYFINNALWCLCGRTAKLKKCINQFPFAGNDLFWYECKHCKRVGEQMISEERARNAWKVKYQPDKHKTW